MIGARDLAFPRLNLLSWYLFIWRRRCARSAALIVRRRRYRLDLLHAVLRPTSPTAMSSLAAAGVFIAGFSSIATGLNFIVTMHMLRAPGMTWFRLPLFVWSMYATSLVMVLATPVLAITLLLLVAADALFGLPIFDPRRGGDPLLFQHLFWFYSHPAVYIMILPAMGVVSEIITCFARRRVFGYKFMVYALLAIAVIGFCGLGPPHVRRGPVGLRQPGLLVPVLHRRRALGDQGVQLDGHAVPRLDPLRSADALRARLHRPVHHRRP